MQGIESITYKEKVIIYIRRYAGCEDEDKFPEEVTQEGIARGVHMSRTHVSRIVQDLAQEGYIDERTGKVKGRPRKLKVYIPTKKGMAKAGEIISELGDITVIGSGGRKNIPVEDIYEKSGGKLTILDVIDMLEQGKDSIDLDKIGPREPVRILEERPTVKKLYGRGRTLEKIDSWLKSSTPVAVLYGSIGVGTSSIASRFLDSVRDRHVVWISLEDRTREEIESKLNRFISDTGEDSGLNDLRALIVFDNYHHIDDDVVEMMTALIDDLDRGDELKVMITAREGTPVYERFYQVEQLRDGKVQEFRIGTLDTEEAQKILGVTLEDEALKAIMQMTKGSPLLLRMLDEGDTEGMHRVSPLTRGQISLLMYLKTRKLNEE